MINLDESRGRVHKLRLTSLGKLPHGYAVYESVAIQLAEDIIKSVGSCGECKYGLEYEELIDCGINYILRQKDFFCADFERKEPCGT